MVRTDPLTRFLIPKQGQGQGDRTGSGQGDIGSGGQVPDPLDKTMTEEAVLDWVRYVPLTLLDPLVLMC